MSRYSLVDPYVPATAGPPGEVAQAAARAGIDALVYVAYGWDELPDEEAIAELARRDDRPTVHPAMVAFGPGYRFAVLLPDWQNEAVYNALETLASPAGIQAAVTEAGGCALPTCPRQTLDGEVMRRTPPLAPEPHVGVVAQVVGASELGRDLDTEDAGAAGRRVLGASGPFAGLGDLGTFMTLVPGDARDVEVLVEALNRGLGLAVEISDDDGDRPGQSGGEGGGRKGKGRRRRRRRGGRGKKPGASSSD